MDDVGHVALVEDGRERRQVRDVAPDDVDRRQLLGGHDLGQPARVGTEVERRDRRPVPDERAHRPGPDAAHGTRDQVPPPGPVM